MDAGEQQLAVGGVSTQVQLYSIHDNSASALGSEAGVARKASRKVWSCTFLTSLDPTHYTGMSTHARTEQGRGLPACAHWVRGREQGSCMRRCCAPSVAWPGRRRVAVVAELLATLSM